MRCLVMFITAICVLFLLKLKWPKNKSVYDYHYHYYFFCEAPRIISRGQDGAILPARVAAYSAGFGSSLPLMELLCICEVNV